MRTSKSKAIILGNKDFGELHKLMFLYTEEFGKIVAIAKGARKITSKFTGHLETLNIGEASLYFGPKNIILSDISTLKNFHNIRQSYEKSSNALQASKLTNELIYENQIIENLTDLIENYLNALNLYSNSYLITTAYTIKLLNKLGLTPNFKELKSKKLDEKYIKFFHFMNQEPLKKIAKTNITITKEESQTINEIIKSLSNI